jgi:hypothetical protein
MMNFRDYFQRKLSGAVVVLPIGFFLITLEGLLGAEWFSYAQITTFIGTGVVFAYRYRVKCPSCRKRITFLANLQDARYFQLSKSVHYCPYCGNTLECEVDEVTGEI